MRAEPRYSSTNESGPHYYPLHTTSSITILTRGVAEITLININTPTDSLALHWGWPLESFLNVKGKIFPEKTKIFPQIFPIPFVKISINISDWRIEIIGWKVDLKHPSWTPDIQWSLAWPWPGTHCLYSGALSGDHLSSTFSVISHTQI